MGAKLLWWCAAISFFIGAIAPIVDEAPILAMISWLCLGLFFVAVAAATAKEDT